MHSVSVIENRHVKCLRYIAYKGMIFYYLVNNNAVKYMVNYIIGYSIRFKKTKNKKSSIFLTTFSTFIRKSR